MLWDWLLGRLRPSVIVPPAPITPPQEHAEAERRMERLKRGADRLERLARDYKETGGAFR